MRGQNAFHVEVIEMPVHAWAYACSYETVLSSLDSDVACLMIAEGGKLPPRSPVNSIVQAPEPPQLDAGTSRPMITVSFIQMCRLQYTHLKLCRECNFTRVVKY